MRGGNPADGRRSCGSSALGAVSRIEETPALEHGAGNGEQTVADGAQGPTVAVASLAQFGVAAPAGGIELGGNAGPVIQGLGQALVAGQATDDEAGLAAALGDG